MKATLPAPVSQEPVDYWKVLCSKAFEVVQGMDYNKVASEMRDNAEGFAPFFYEVVCKEDRPWENFKDRVYPSFVRYLNYKSLDPGPGQGLIVSLYYEERFYLIRGPGRQVPREPRPLGRGQGAQYKMKLPSREAPPFRARSFTS